MHTQEIESVDCIIEWDERGLRLNGEPITARELVDYLESGE
jgi:hypothetical protein